MKSCRIEGQKGIYLLKDLIGEGAFGQSWSAEVVGERETGAWLVAPGPEVGGTVVMKWARLSDEYAPSEQRAFLNDVNAFTTLEMSALERLAGLSCVAQVYDYGTVDILLRDGTRHPAICLVEELLKGRRLDDYLKDEFGSGTGDEKVFGGIPAAKNFFDLAARLATTARAIHHRGVIHGDIWIENIFVDDSGQVRFFDFGDCAIRDTTFLHSGAHAAARSDEYVAPERRKERRHGRRSDIFSLGGVFYYMATGKSPPRPEPDIDTLKSGVVAGVETHNSKLLQENCGIADIIARCLRYDKDERIRDADALLEEIRLFSSEQPGFDDGANGKDCVECLLSTTIPSDDLFARMLRIDAARLKSRADDMEQGILEVSGTHEELVFGMSAYLSILRQGDCFLARTTPRFWSRHNMGINGRFLSMFRLLAQRGVIVRHLMLVCDRDKRSSEARPIFEAHRAALAHSRITGTCALEFTCREVPEEERNAWMREGRWEVCYEVSGSKTKAVQTVYDGNNILRSLRFIRESGATAVRHCDRMNKDVAAAEPLEEWLNRA